MSVLLDTGATINSISQRFACLLKDTIISIEIPIPQTFQGDNAYCYGAHSITLSIRDDWEQQRMVTSVFYATDQAGPEIICGMPYLEAAGIQIDCKKHVWRWGINEDDITLDNPETFIKNLDNQATVYAIIIAGTNQEPSQKQAISLPKDYSDFEDVFSAEKAGELPVFKTGDHSIDLVEGGEPSFGPLYNLSNTELAVLRRYLDDALAKGWIRHSLSPAGAPILFVPKTDGGLRLCVDYRALNKITVKNRHPLPLISETLDRLVGSKLFTKLDLKDAYHRIRIKRGDEWKTAFRTRYGHFEYLVMPFGLTNAPATFQAYINKALVGLVDITCVVYLDDILIFSDTHANHLRAVREVLSRLRQHELYVSLQKCAFSTSQVEFLGFIISEAGVSMDKGRVKAIEEWPRPQTFRDVQSFLGFTNFYRRFIHRYSNISAPLTDLLKGSKDGRKLGNLIWKAREELAFRFLKATFTKAPLLRHYDPAKPLRLETDASAFAIAGILSQLFEDSLWHPIAFWSRKLNAAESHYETHDQELLAIVVAFKHWRHYCEGHSLLIEVLTDHNNLRGFMSVKSLTGRRARWAVELAAFDFEIKHRAGKYNPADGPSRRADYARETQAVNTLLPSLQRKLSLISSISVRGRNTRDTNQRLREPRPKDETLVSNCLEKHTISIRSAMASPLDPATGTVGCKQLVPRYVVRAITTGETAYSSPPVDLRELILSLQQGDDFVKSKRIAIEKQGNTRAGSAKAWSFDAAGTLRYDGALYVPDDKAVKAEILRRNHDDPLAGHFGQAKTLQLASRKYFWKEMAKEIKSYVKSCDICQRTKVLRHRPYGEMVALPLPDRPWKEISMDFITGLPPSVRYDGVYDAIFVVVDRYTKFARYLPTRKDTSAVDMAELFLTTIVTSYGMPSGIVSDRDPRFTSAFWTELCFVLHSKRRLSTSFHPQTDGQTERQNQTLQQYLRIFVTEQQENWAKLLPLAEFAYNNSPLASRNQKSPFELLMGYAPIIHYDIEDNSRLREVPAAIERAERLNKDREELEKLWLKASETQAKYYNQKHTPKVYKVGDLVLLTTENLKQKRPSRKLSHRQIGPFRILEAIGKQAYRLELPDKYRIHNVFHVSCLEPFYGRDNESEPQSYNAPDLIDGQEEYEIEYIEDDMRQDNKLYYRVKWLGWPEDYNQWIPEDELQNAAELRLAYEAQKQGNRRRR